MRRTTAAVAAASALALVGGAIVALPAGPASAAVAPKLVSVKASPSTVTTVGELNAAKKVTITAVYNDPDNAIKAVGFSNSGTRLGVGYNQDFSSTGPASRRTFTWVFDADYNDDPGVTKVYVEAQKQNAYSVLIPGTVGYTSYTIKNKPLLSVDKNTGLAVWGTKTKLYGNLTSTPDNANKKIKIQFKAKGKKKWKKRQVVRTNADGLYFTKKFKINKRGTWRATYAGSKYVLKAKDTWVAKPGR